MRFGSLTEKRKSAGELSRQRAHVEGRWERWKELLISTTFNREAYRSRPEPTLENASADARDMLHPAVPILIVCIVTTPSDLGDGAKRLTVSYDVSSFEGEPCRSVSC